MHIHTYTHTYTHTFIHIHIYTHLHTHIYIHTHTYIHTCTNTYNHRHRECRGALTCPLCAGSHSLKECTASSQNYKCINCQNFNMHNKGASINDNHSALDRNCPSLKAVLEKYKQNTDYGDGY